jgi:hypothetical protein
LKRKEKSTKYLRYEFIEGERLGMGKDLAEAHNKLADIDAEEQVIKAQIKERKAGLEQKIKTLSRNIFNGFEMRNVSCTMRWNSPITGKCEYYRDDTGELVDQRDMSSDEMQEELEFSASAD